MQVRSTCRSPNLEVVRITEAAAIGAAHLMGRGDNERADRAVVDARRSAMDQVSFNGTTVIGDGERDEAVWR